MVRATQGILGILGSLIMCYDGSIHLTGYIDVFWPFSEQFVT